LSSSRNTKKSCKFDGQVTTASMLIRLTPSLTALNMDIGGEVVELEVSSIFWEIHLFCRHTSLQILKIYRTTYAISPVRLCRQSQEGHPLAILHRSEWNLSIVVEGRSHIRPIGDIPEAPRFVNTLDKSLQGFVCNI
jgi:hypothetical protein